MYVKQSAGYVETRQPRAAGHNDDTSVQKYKPHNGIEKEKHSDLESLFGKVIQKHTDKLQVDSCIPESLSKGFTQSIESYQRTAPTLLARSAQQAAQSHPENPGLALLDFHGDLLVQTDRLHNIQVVHGTILQQYLTILRDRVEEDYLFISEKGSHTCDQCESLHGQLFGKQDLARGGIIPPLHPNCRCSLVALDSVGVLHYNSPNREDMLRRLGLALDALGGDGIFILDPRFSSFGISPDTLTRLDLRVETPILGLDPKLQDVYRELFVLMEEMGHNAEETLTEFRSDTAATFSKILSSSLTLLEAFFQRGKDLFAYSAEVAQEDFLLGAVLFVDAVFFGLASAVVSEVGRRSSAFFDEPGLLTGANLLTLGLVDAICGAFNPEELWSPEHMADIIGVVGILSLLSLPKSTLSRSVPSADEFARSALDDLARGSADDVMRARLRPPELLDELVRSGEKHSIDNVVAITKTPEGKLVWLETGNESAGLNHILARHEADFASRGVTAAEIPELIVETLENGIMLRARGQGGKVYDVLFHGQVQRVLIVVSDNGFIVNFYPN